MNEQMKGVIKLTRKSDDSMNKNVPYWKQHIVRYNWHTPDGRSDGKDEQRGAH